MDQLAEISGEELHQKIAPERWCVSRRDLQLLRQNICEAVKSGQIQPHENDCFDPADGVVGPNVYTVVEQYIKPVTATLGNMSWALMRNPSGLKCDLFITHAWAEGIFELIDKVLSSWPSKSHHAYICALANPQNLDIHSLICCPMDSPFAKALSSCTHILVVPNRTASIYSRLWCVYEAYLGHCLGKVILTSRRPLRPVFVGSLVKLCPFAVVATVCGLVCPLTYFLTEYEEQLFVFFQYIFASFAVLLDKPWRLKRLLSALGLASTIYFAFFRNYYCISKFNFEIYPSIVDCYFYWISLVLVFVAATFDCDCFEEASFEAGELRHGFSGDVRDARCTMHSDIKTIQAELGERVDAVNHTISVLLDAGISTPELCAVHERGIRVEQAGRINYGVTAIGFAAWMRIGLMLPYFVSGQPKRQIAMLASCIGWCLIWFFSEKDGRAFASAAIGRVFYMTELMFFVWLAAIYGLDMRRTQKSHYDVYNQLMVVAGVLTFFVSALGPLRLLQLPLCGRPIVRYLMTKRYWRCCEHCLAYICPRLVRSNTQPSMPDASDGSRDGRSGSCELIELRHVITASTSA